MTDLVLTDEQASLLAAAGGHLTLRDPRRRLASDEPRYTLAEVLDHLKQASEQR